MLYKVEEYSDIIGSFKPELQKKYNQIKRLSKDFTENNEAARQMDIALCEVIELGEHSKERESFERLRADFEGLFNSLKDSTGNNSNIDTDLVQSMILKELRLRKIGMQQLDKDVLDMLTKTTMIKWEIPNVKTKATKSSVSILPKLVDSLMLGQNLFLIGGAGTGKTTLAEDIAENILGRKYYTINCSQWTSPIEIIGGQTMEGYKEGKLIRAWNEGAMLILDELPKLDPNTAGLLNDALAKSAQAGKKIENAKGDKFDRHKDFCVVATGNIYPNSEDIAYGANNKQDLSLLDRFTGSVWWINENFQLEQELTVYDFIWKAANQIRQAIKDNKWEAQMSLRWMIGARNVFALEEKRRSEKSTIEGLTLKDFLDSYLSTFTEEQRTIIKDKMDYSSFVATYKSEMK